MTTHIETPVLIAGGGPVGLALALDLGYQGVDCLLAEQEAGTALVVQAKAGTHNERTMEYCRRWGLVDQIAAAYPDDEARDTVYCTALDGHYIDAADDTALADGLRQAASGKPDIALRIDADGQASHAAVVRALEAARLAHIGKVHFLTQARP